MIVFVNGTFDLLHRGHLEMLKFASELKHTSFDQLVVAIDSDRRVAELKGPSRPVINQEDRKFFLSSLKYVDVVHIFDSDEELDSIIKRLQPTFMVKGSDYVGKPIIGAEHCAGIIFFERLNDYSTTKTIQDLARR